VSDPAQVKWARSYSRVLTDGTVNVPDHEDAHSAIVFAPALIFEKTVINVTSGEDPATVATPGDRLQYSLRIENASDTPLAGFRLVDELDRLNATPVFQAGTLNVITVPDDANVDATDPAGGASASGLLDIDNLSLGGLGDSVLVEFEIDLSPVIANDSLVYNQSEILFADLPVAISDDPNINDVADPAVAGDEDPTEVRIESAPAFRIEKISAYLDGDPSVLLAGERLRYTITVQNTGTDNATGVDLADLVPANTAYIPGSALLNGNALPNANAAASPLADGVQINAPQDGTAGLLNAGVADNVATINFDVIVDPDAVDGAIVSNQAFVGAADYGIAGQPSDDPRTPLADDPTRDVVGNFPLLFAPKSALLEVDQSSLGIVDPGDVLRYTITVYNNGAIPATEVALTDLLPANTSYVADSMTLNGLPTGQPDGGVFPLIAGIPVSSADLTPPLPGEGEGVLNRGQEAVVQFDLRIDDGLDPGTLISNQAVVYSAELPNLLTDGDGNPTTGPEPTIVVVGNVQQLSIVNDVAVVNGGLALAGAELEYSVTVRNIGAVPAQYVALTDNLDDPNPGYLAYVDQSATLNGLTAGISIAGATISADFGNEYGALAPGEIMVLRFRAIMNGELAEGTTVTNTAQVAWDDPQRWADATVSIDVGAMPDAGMLSGSIWHDGDHDNAPDGAERPLADWTVDLLLNDQPARSTQTNSDGYYRFSGVVPNYAVDEKYSLEFSAPGARARTAKMGIAESEFTDGMQRIYAIDVLEGSNHLDLNMPVDPNGVIYDSVSRSPVAGARVKLVDVRNGVALPRACFDDRNQQGQVTVSNGYYKFDINFSDPACPSGLNYLLQVAVPDNSFISGVSELIPPTSDLQTLPYDVPTMPSSPARRRAKPRLRNFSRPPQSRPAARARTTIRS